MKKILTTLALAGALGLGMRKCNNGYAFRAQQIQVEGEVSELSGYLFGQKKNLYPNPADKNKTFNFNMGPYLIMVNETKSKPYETLTNEIRNGDKVKITVNISHNFPSGEVAYYEVDSDRIERLKAK